ncbi:hypothetical protein BG011_005660 [Mortierella polycephala]|uniref:Bacteriophage T5 Orf172 DNA-binding domain-containing protein n=1 Tax=Mortierella polycephala TaxID=41804 RepID=A0A9P6U0L1_9FUNG|nr:hypothetical protein BG011_005660 [Mortierella polycephala]
MAGADQCKAIAISTGQQCTRKGKLDGYCTEKHREQANGIIPTKAKPRKKQRDTTPSADSDAEYNDEDEDEDEDNDENYEKEDESAPITTKKATKKATKTSKTVKIADVEKSVKVDDVAALAATEKKTVPRKKTAPKTTAKTTGRKKKATESSDEFDSVSEDDDYKPSDSGDYTDSESDDDDDSEDDLEGLSRKLASVKIKPDDPTLPPQPPNDAFGMSLKVKLQRTKSKIFSTNAVLAPPKNKTKSSSASGRPTGGFWVPAPPPVKIPESTIKALAVVKEKLKLESSSSSNEVVPAGAHAATEQKPSGLFKYHARVHQYLFTSDEDLDPDSKRAAMRKFVNDLGSFFHRSKKESDKKPLPEIPSDKQDTSTAVTKPPKQQRTDSQDSVDSITQDIQDLDVKSEKEEEAPNQCHGFNTSGYRCKRRVKLDRPMEKGEVLMCHDHEINEDDEVVVHIEGQGGVLLQWLELSVWVNPGLPDYVQNKLRKAMERSVSETDKPGYIYSYQLKEIRMTATHTLFKVGRTDNVYRRMNEWSDKCGSPPILIEVFPEQGALAPKDENDLADSISKSVSDTDVTGLRCRYSHRVERLIHIELKPYHDKDHVCACKTNHREWFKVPHKPGLNDKEQFQQAWEQIRRVCVHWMAYMERVYGPG